MKYLDLKSNKERLIINLKSAGLENVLLLGHYSYNEAKKGLNMHIHDDMLEICYLETGFQYYQVGNSNFFLKGGDLLITPPNIIHGTSGYPEEKGSLFWMIINVPKVPFNLLNLSYTESRDIIDSLLNLGRLHFKGSVRIKSILSRIFAVYNGNTPLKKVILKNQVLNFLLEVINCAEKSGKKELSPDIGYCCKYISNNIFESIHISTLAKSINLSESRFKHKFKEEIGVPPNEFILIEKIKMAKEVIMSKESSLTDLAYSLGFSSPSYFSTVFKKHEGISPTQFKLSLET